MTIFDSVWFQTLMHLPPLSRLRRNHGLEHATLHLLAQRYPGVSILGYSDLGGFWLIGDVAPEAVQEAVQEALRRLNAGENRLALHPQCGTSIATSGVLAGLAAGFAMLGVGKRLRDKLERLPLAISLATLALTLGQPLGLLLQEKMTTSAQPEGLQVEKIVVTLRGSRARPMKTYRVVTRG